MTDYDGERRRPPRASPTRWTATSRTSHSRSRTRSRASCWRCARSPAGRPTARSPSRCCCWRSARCCSPAAGSACTATSLPADEYEPDAGPDPDLDAMRLRLAGPAGERRRLQRGLRPVRRPARADRRRCSPTTSPASPPPSRTACSTTGPGGSARRCGGGSSPTFDLGHRGQRGPARAAVRGGPRPARRRVRERAGPGGRCGRCSTILPTVTRWPGVRSAESCIRRRRAAVVRSVDRRCPARSSARTDR